jgi:MFS transporter, ACS family, hexuronate transporter
MRRSDFIVRWLPAAAMALVSIISYVDRNTLALLAPTILRETRLSATEYGFVVSAYSIAFMVGNPLWGRALDRIGLRLGMIAAVAIWSIASTAHAFAAGFWGLAAARAVLGIGEGASAPGGLRTVMQTLPPLNRARGIALTYSGGSAGAILTPIVIAPIAAIWGWRGAFWATGLFGAAWIAGWLVLSRRADLALPDDVREVRDARAGQAAEARIERVSDAWTEHAADAVIAKTQPRVSDPRLWAFLLAYSLGALPLGFVTYCAALYFNKELGLSQLTIGKVLWVPPLGSEFGIFFWGWLADRLAWRTDKITAVTTLLPVAVLIGLQLIVLPYSHRFELVLAQLFMAMFVASAFQVLVISWGAEVFAAEHAGFIGGVASGAYGAGLALLMPMFGHLFDAKSYGMAFALAAACPVIGYACFRLLSAGAGASTREAAPSGERSQA